jgi:hypothetical protein
MTKDLRASQLQTNQIVTSGSSGTNARLVIYPVERQSTANPNQGIINPALFNTSSIGTDVFLFVSGGIGQRNSTNSKAISVFGGDVVVSGNLYISGSKSYTQFITVAGYLATQASSSNPEVAGQTSLNQTEINNNSIILRGVLSTFTSSITATLKLYNITSGAYVEIGGPNITTLSTTNTTPTLVQSVNLLTATNFGTGSNIYETQVYTSDITIQVYHGSTTFVCT